MKKIEFINVKVVLVLVISVLITCAGSLYHFQTRSSEKVLVESRGQSETVSNEKGSADSSDQHKKGSSANVSIDRVGLVDDFDSSRETDEEIAATIGLKDVPSLSDICYALGKYFAADDLGNVYISADLKAWKSKKVAEVVNDVMSDTYVTIAGDEKEVFLVVNNQLCYSKDGVKWSKYNIKDPDIHAVFYFGYKKAGIWYFCSEGKKLPITIGNLKIKFVNCASEDLGYPQFTSGGYLLRTSAKGKLIVSKDFTTWHNVKTDFKGTVESIDELNIDVVSKNMCRLTVNGKIGAYKIVKNANGYKAVKYNYAHTKYEKLIKMQNELDDLLLDEYEKFSEFFQVFNGVNDLFTLHQLNSISSFGYKIVNNMAFIYSDYGALYSCKLDDISSLTWCGTYPKANINLPELSDRELKKFGVGKIDGKYLIDSQGLVLVYSADGEKWKACEISDLITVANNIKDWTNAGNLRPRVQNKKIVYEVKSNNGKYKFKFDSKNNIVLENKAVSTILHKFPYKNDGKYLGANGGNLPIKKWDDNSGKDKYVDISTSGKLLNINIKKPELKKIYYFNSTYFVYASDGYVYSSKDLKKYTKKKYNGPFDIEEDVGEYATAFDKQSAYCVTHNGIYKSKDFATWTKILKLKLKDDYRDLGIAIANNIICVIDYAAKENKTYNLRNMTVKVLSGEKYASISSDGVSFATSYVEDKVENNKDNNIFISKDATSCINSGISAEFDFDDEDPEDEFFASNFELTKLNNKRYLTIEYGSFDVENYRVFEIKQTNGQIIKREEKDERIKNFLIENIYVNPGMPIFLTQSEKTYNDLYLVGAYCAQESTQQICNGKVFYLGDFGFIAYSGTDLKTWKSGVIYNRKPLSKKDLLKNDVGGRLGVRRVGKELWYAFKQGEGEYEQNYVAKSVNGSSWTYEFSSYKRVPVANLTKSGIAKYKKHQN